MADLPQTAYEFGPFRLVPGERRLLRLGEPLRLAPKAFDTLLLLVQNPDRLINKDEFLNRVWGDTFVGEVTLAHSISEVRKALGNGNSAGAYIETVAKRGYRFVAPVRLLAAAPETARSQVLLAVLPFENLSSDADREYLADGLTEELIAVLGQIDPEHLSAVGRTTMMAYKRTRRSLSEIGRELGATFLIESSIRAERGRVRITSGLVRGADQVQIWSASYDSEPNGVLSFQRELSTIIAEQVRLRLSPERLNALVRRQAHNAEAYDVYLRGRWFWNHFTPATTRQAVECFVRTTDLDPDYALAWAGLADAYASSPIHADVQPAAVWDKARQAAELAVQINADLPEVQTSVGILKFWLDWDWPAAERAFRRAIALDPSYSLAWRTLGVVLAHMGRVDGEAQRAMQRARSLDPLQAMHHALSGQVSFVLRDFAAAIEFARQSTIILSDFWVGHYVIAQAREQLGEYELALEALTRAAGFGGYNSKLLSLRGYILAKMGRHDEARSVLKTLESLGQERYSPPYATALVFAGMGERDAALQWLEMALNVHDVHLALLATDPKWDGFRRHQSFANLIRRCGMESTHLPE